MSNTSIFLYCHSFLKIKIIFSAKPYLVCGVFSRPSSSRSPAKTVAPTRCFFFDSFFSVIDFFLFNPLPSHEHNYPYFTMFRQVSIHGFRNLFIRYHIILALSVSGKFAQKRGLYAPLYYIPPLPI